MWKSLLLAGWAVVCLESVEALAGTYFIHQKSQWEKWDYPKGVVTFGEDGSVSPVRLRRNINAVSNAKAFQHESKDAKGMVTGGLWNARIRICKEGGKVKRIQRGIIKPNHFKKLHNKKAQ